MNEDIKFNLLLMSIILMSIICGSLIMKAYDNHRLNEYTQTTLLNAEQIVNKCKVNYNQDYIIKQEKNKLVVELNE